MRRRMVSEGNGVDEKKEEKYLKKLSKGLES